MSLAPLLPGASASVAFSPDGQLLASAHKDHTVRLWRLRDGALLPALKEHYAAVTRVGFSPNGQLLASGDDFHSTGKYTQSCVIYLWQMPEGTLLRREEELEGVTVMALTFSPDGQLLASAASADGAVHVWRVSDLKRLHTLEVQGVLNSLLGWFPFWTGRRATSVAFSPNGQVLASGSADTMIRLWRMSDATHLRTLEGHKDSVNSVAFSPHGYVLASGSADGTVRLWEVADGALLRELDGHGGAVVAVAFAPDGHLLACGAADGKVRLWWCTPE